MAQVNTNYLLPSYITDFDKVYEKLPVVVEGNVPTELLVALGYTDRTVEVACTVRSKRRKLRPRHIIATFPDGSKNRFIYGGVTPAALVTFCSVLVNKGGAICLELEGEQYGVLTSAQYGSVEAKYKSSPYTNIPAGKVFNRVQYKYTSDALTTAVTLSTRIENAPSDLYTCQTDGLDSATVITGKAICSGSGLGIIPRHFNIEALSTVSIGVGITTTSGVKRKANVSELKNLASTVTKIAPCAYCLSYKGESIKHLENVIVITPGVVSV